MDFQGVMLHNKNLLKQCQKGLQITNDDKDVERREHSYTVGGNVNWCSHYGKHYGSLWKFLEN